MRLPGGAGASAARRPRAPAAGGCPPAARAAPGLPTGSPVSPIVCVQKPWKAISTATITRHSVSSRQWAGGLRMRRRSARARRVRVSAALVGSGALTGWWSWCRPLPLPWGCGVVFVWPGAVERPVVVVFVWPGLVADLPPTVLPLGVVPVRLGVVAVLADADCEGGGVAAVPLGLRPALGSVGRLAADRLRLAPAHGAAGAWWCRGAGRAATARRADGVADGTVRGAASAARVTRAGSLGGAVMRPGARAQARAPRRPAARARAPRGRARRARAAAGR